MFIGRNQNVAAKIGNTFQFTSEVNGFFPTGNGLGSFLADVADAEQFGFGGGENFWCLAEMFEQRPGAHRPDVFDHVQRDECFAGIHAGPKSFKLQVESFKWQNNFLRPIPKIAVGKSFCY
jgi:hypothetical protein